ncbi:hypothetical protein TNCT_217381 [Trichonephila clavata]|uniref:Uncharacterized protein n=1 Tax=Trichonephila clavata TaxID=2740835 RepID=A0A8X6GZQ4_TRICU|nr:hypothetical protein TNCT_217381 [Trichonephila clavata]
MYSGLIRGMTYMKQFFPSPKHVLDVGQASGNTLDPQRKTLVFHAVDWSVQGVSINLKKWPKVAIPIQNYGRK